MEEKYSIYLDDAIIIDASDHAQTLIELFGKGNGEYSMFLVQVSPVNEKLAGILEDELSIEKDYCSIKSDDVEMRPRAMNFAIWYLITDKEKAKNEASNDISNLMTKLVIKKVEDILKKEGLTYKITNMRGYEP